MSKANRVAHFGAVFCVFWGLLHCVAAYNVFHLACDIPPTMESRRLLHLASYLVSFATASIIVAMALNLRNGWLGLWLNGIAIGIADVPFIFSYYCWLSGVFGPALLIAGGSPPFRLWLL